MQALRDPDSPLAPTGDLIEPWLDQRAGVEDAMEAFLQMAALAERGSPD